MPKAMESKVDRYEHQLIETRCDVCAQITLTPLWSKVDTEHWRLWFFCSAKHRREFGERLDEGLSTLQ